MTKTKLLSVGIIFLIVFGGFIGIFTIIPDLIKGGQAHSSIMIVGNGNFTGANGVVSGNGTEPDPYIISDWVINSDSAHGIEIKNTMSHFLIRNITINASISLDYNGIRLDNVKNGIIQNVTLTNNQNGIHIIHSENITVTDSICSDNEVYGIDVQYSSDITISDNDIIKNLLGCRLFYSNYNDISDNEVSNNSQRGLTLDASDLNNISGNNFQANYGIGIFLTNNSDNNSVYSNDVINNTGGIDCTESNDNTLEYNVMKYNLNAGLAIDISTRNIFINNKLDRNNWGGVVISNSHENIISSNEFYSADTVGISLHNSNDNIIISNIIAKRYEGITIYNSPGSELTNNRMENSGITLSGDPDDMMKVSINSSNTVNDKPVYFFRYYIFPDDWFYFVPADAGQVILLRCSNIICEFQNLSQTTTGLTVLYSEKITVTNIKASSNSKNGIYFLSSNNSRIGYNAINENSENGILLEDSIENLIVYNNCSGNGENGIYDDYNSNQNEIESNICNSNGADGIKARSVSGCDFIENDCFYNSEFGISLISSEKNEIKNNNYKHNGKTGIGLYFGDENLLSNNTVSLNGDSGLDLIYSDRNILNENTIFENNYGIKLHETFSNRFYHNNIIDNSIQTSLSQDNINYWNASYPTGGNYWSDHNKHDFYRGVVQDIQGRDGISDSTYPIAVDNIDYYPLAKPFGDMPTKPWFLNATSGYFYVNLTWGAPLNEGSFPVHYYRIYKSKDNIEFSQLADVKNALTFNDTNVKNGKTYYYRVTSNHPAGESPYSQMLEVFVGSLPSPPINIKVTYDFDKINLTWEPNPLDRHLNITNYRIYRGFQDNYIHLHKEIGNVTYFVDDETWQGADCYYRISAINLIGEGKKSSIIHATAPSVPYKPVNLSISSGSTYIILTWDPPEHDSGYPVQGYHVFRNTTWIFFRNIANTTSGILFYNDTDVIAGINYTYKIQAFNLLGPGNFSTEVISSAEGKVSPPQNSLPMAIIHVEETAGRAPFTIIFEGSGYDSDGWIVSYRWDLNDGEFSNDKNVTHTYNILGTYEVELTVVDNNGGVGKTAVLITVNSVDEPPPPDENKGSSLWSTAAIATIIIGLILIILVLFVIPGTTIIHPPPEREMRGVNITKKQKRLKEEFYEATEEESADEEEE